MGKIINYLLAVSIGVANFIHLSSVGFAKEVMPAPPKLEDAFLNNAFDEAEVADTEEEEPVVVGREKWDEEVKQIDSSVNTKGKTAKAPILEPVEELDAIETKQSNLDDTNLPIKPPSPPPATNIHRNFEGKLVLQPRRLGLLKDFPFQLENASGRRLAYVDFKNVSSVNPVLFTQKKVNVLGKLEPIEEGSKNLVIRARLLRLVD